MRAPTVPEQSRDSRRGRDLGHVLVTFAWVSAGFLFVYLALAAAVGVLAR